MSTQIKIPAPIQHDLDGGKSITATVAKVDDMIAILVDKSDAANISYVMFKAKGFKRTDRKALNKLSELIDAEL